MLNIGIIGCIFLWFVGVVVGVVVIGLLVIFFYGLYLGLGLFF